MSKKLRKSSKISGKHNASVNTSKIGVDSKIVEEDVVRCGDGNFTFANGDSYEGEYIVINNAEIYRHGHGVYRTSDGDEYRAVWDKDCIVKKLHLMYSNGAEYNGDVDEKGAMNGRGSYVFPDKTTLNAKWRRNVPIGDYRYDDPLGYAWLGNKSQTNQQEVVFKPVNVIRDGDELLP